MAVKIVITDGDFPNEDPEREELASISAELVRGQWRTEDELIAGMKDAEAILICFSHITRRVIEESPALKMIARYGIGYDMIDLKAASERGIPVTNVPDYCWDEVADHAFALLMTCARKILVLDKSVRDGAFDPIAAGQPIRRLRGQTLGLIGMGHIGQNIVARAHGFGLRVIVADPYLKPEQVEEIGATLVDMNEVLTESDYITLHVPLNDETRHLMNVERLQQMKSSAFLINTCRGGVVDNAALARALSEGWIAGAGIDVFEEEPLPADSPLRSQETAVLTPHAAYYSEESLALLQRKAAQEVVRFFKGEQLLNRVN